MTQLVRHGKPEIYQLHLESRHLSLSNQTEYCVKSMPAHHRRLPACMHRTAGALLWSGAQACAIAASTLKNILLPLQSQSCGISFPRLSFRHVATFGRSPECSRPFKGVPEPADVTLPGYLSH